MRRFDTGAKKGRYALGMLLALLLTVQLPCVGTLAAESSARNASGGENRAISVDPAGRTEGYSAVLYNNTNGLPTSEANAIAETSDGFLWIGSYGGLIRYDGSSFVRMDSTTGVASVTCLYVDGRQRLWIGTNDAGIAVMERGEFRQWGEAEGLRSLHINSMIEDGRGVIYAATVTGVATIDAEGNVGYVDDPQIADAYVDSLRMGSDGAIYGATVSGDILCIRDGVLVSCLDHEESGVPGVCYVLPDPNAPGKVYLGTDSSTVCYGTPERKFSDLTSWDISPLFNVSSMEFIDGQLWLTAENGVGVLSADGFHALDDLPMNSSVESVMTDYEGNLWFASSRLGVMKIVPNRFTDLFDRYDLPQAVVNATCLYDGLLFLGTDTGLSVLDKDGPVESVPLTKAETASGVSLEADDLLTLLDGKRVRSIVRDSRGRLWIATWKSEGLLRYDRGEVLAFTPEDGLFSNRVRAVCECGDGSVLAVNTGGVSVIRGDRVAGGYGKDEGVVNAESLTAVEGFHGEIILGSDGSGIYIIDETGVRNLATRDGLASGIVMRVKRDDARRVYWIVTSNSLAYMTEDYRVTTIRAFPYSNNFDLYENSKGDMWVLASDGIYVVPADELLANGALRPVFYGLANGLPCIATANSYSELTDSGDLYIAGSTGVAKVNIETPFENVDELKAAVPYIEADGRRVYPDESGTFTIPFDVQKLTVYSYVFNYALSDPLVSHRLEGLEQSEITVSRSDLQPVDYTNLRGGAYRFVLRLHDAMGRGDREISVRIVKEKAFYEQTWFYVGAGLALLLLLLAAARLYVRRKTRKLEKKQQENMTFIREITEAFAKVIDMKDKYTRGHSIRVARYTARLAEELGCDADTVEKYYRIALLHDIGKIGVPPEVLNKNGKLTDEEFHAIQSHTTQGYEALKDISIMPELAVGAQAHHERPDGRGYPNHLKAGEIPRVAEIIAVADCFDAMYSNRPYRTRMNFEKVVSIIKEVSGTQLAPDVVDAFLRLVDKGEFRAPDDHGGGSMENIENIRDGMINTPEMVH